MIINHVNPEEFAQFFKFWFWQYTSRNQEYRKAYEDFVNPEIPQEFIEKASEHFCYDFSEDSIKILWGALEGVPGSVQRIMNFCGIEDPWLAQCQINQFGAPTKKERDERRKHFEETFLCSPKNPNEDNDSEKILQDIINGCLDKNIPNFNLILFQDDIVRTIEPTQFTYFVDTQRMPLKRVLWEVRHWYTMHQPLLPEERPRELAKLSAGVIDNINPGFKRDYTIRAVGLWLWDHKMKKEMNGVRNYPISKAIRDLYKIHDIEGEGCGSLSELPTSSENPATTLKNLTRYYNATKNSIENQEVMPIPN
jgi:hypothetical protein